MTIEQTLRQRSESKCELCGSENDLNVFEVAPSDSSAEQSAFLCTQCQTQISGAELDENHWHCLRDSMWNPNPAVQVLAWRMLKRLPAGGWAQDLLDMMYLEDDIQKWAEAGLSNAEDDDNTPTLDSNGTPLQDGDTVTIIKDLVVKGAGFTAKRGTAVRNISLTSNPEHIEGRVNGTRIVLLSCYLKKSN
ncbi:PhnA domain-containing protein [Sansalvadorimonas verongulae]|uniref:PhnA domain-containing protein n=1 Tax=Sansalvadorimonas verongulae TaxID=2172824 RepID=UPI0012BCBFA3|nr:alkylphosphonate utilization protein [Sansalvadorimonas verongulae]MTI14639.1 PhnA domain protein [Sansalvadorimonas verongulae]